MTYPGRGVMETLGALALGEEFRLSWDTGEMAVRVSGSSWVLVDGDHWDELSARGWAEAGEDVVTVTERGLYWLDRWLKANRKTLAKEVGR